ncbi:MinD/ParA family ATP-binding protein [Micromonospora sonneratiae]|uniref:Chromosome partitioning protein n=1 Tax=Micromonospora sonneratiae TaxID=1184706 RepID=A0ABW3YEK7_9ACTN
MQDEHTDRVHVPGQGAIPQRDVEPFWAPDELAAEPWASPGQPQPDGGHPGHGAPLAHPPVPGPVPPNQQATPPGPVYPPGPPSYPPGPPSYPPGPPTYQPGPPTYPPGPPNQQATPPGPPSYPPGPGPVPPNQQGTPPADLPTRAWPVVGPPTPPTAPVSPGTDLGPGNPSVPAAPASDQPQPKLGDQPESDTDRPAAPDQQGPDPEAGSEPSANSDPVAGRASTRAALPVTLDQPFTMDTPMVGGPEPAEGPATLPQAAQSPWAQPPQRPPTARGTAAPPVPRAPEPRQSPPQGGSHPVSPPGGGSHPVSPPGGAPYPPAPEPAAHPTSPAGTGSPAAPPGPARPTPAGYPPTPSMHPPAPPGPPAPMPGWPTPVYRPGDAVPPGPPTPPGIPGPRGERYPGVTPVPQQPFQDAPGVVRMPPQPGPAYPEPVWTPENSAPTADEFARRRAVRPPDPVATMGLRAAVNRTSLGLVRLSPGRHEQEVRQDIDTVRRNFGGLRQVTVVNPKGGAGKTVAILLLAMTFGQRRGGYVLAWDNNETQGTLGMRAQQDFHARTVRDLLRDLGQFQGAHGRVGDLSQYVRSQGEGMFDVLASDESATGGEMLTASAFAELREVVSRFYKLIFVDTGNNVRAQNWQAAIDATDQLLITMSARNDSAETAARMLDHLEQSGRQRLVRQAVTVVSMPPSRKEIDLPAIQQHFAARTRAVLLAPYERLIDAGEPIRYGQLSSATKDAWLKIAAAVAEGL